MIKSIKELFKNAEFVKYFYNTGWLFTERMLKTIVSIIVSIFFIRYLGPENYGILSFAQSYVMLFIPLISLGMDSILVRDLVNSNEKRDEILGTSFILKITGGFALIIVVLISVFVMENDQITNIIMVIIALGLFFQTFNVIDIYFQSKVQSKFIAVANIIALSATNALIIILIILEAELIFFAIVVSSSNILSSLGYLFFYYYKGLDIRKWRYNVEIAKGLLKDSWPLILSSIAITVHIHIDRVMIGDFLTKTDVGIYSVPSNIVIYLSFIPVIITNSLFPAVIESKKSGEKTYLSRLQKLLDMLIWMGVSIGIVFSVFSYDIIHLLYGKEFIASSIILSILIWEKAFTFFSIAASKYIIIENITKINLYRTLIGVSLNIILNLILIPAFGSLGAAIASILSVTTQSWIALLLFKETRGVFYMFIKSFNLYRIYKKGLSLN